MISQTDNIKPTLLLIDTATPVSSIALTHGEDMLLSLLETDAISQHSSILAPMVSKALERAKDLNLKIDAVGLSSGPGSYTGLRIGSSLAKGICQGFDIPLVSISTLEMMTDGYRQMYKEAIDDASILYPMIDARRMEVYTAPFDSTGEKLADAMPMVLGEEVTLFDCENEHNYHFFGNGASKASVLNRPSMEIQDTFVPQAEYMRSRAIARLRAGDVEDLAYWTPNYLKEYVVSVQKNKVLDKLS